MQNGKMKIDHRRVHHSISIYHNYKEKQCLAIHQKLDCDPCDKEIEEGSRIWIQTHKNEGFDCKLEKPFILNLLGDAEKYLAL
ncbi:MAG: hypothetical protein WCF23_21210 [Candidatus Nitrosopolaris sp.]